MILTCPGIFVNCTICTNLILSDPINHHFDSIRSSTKALQWQPYLWSGDVFRQSITWSNIHWAFIDMYVHLDKFSHVFVSSNFASFSRTLAAHFSKSRILQRKPKLAAARDYWVWPTFMTLTISLQSWNQTIELLPSFNAYKSYSQTFGSQHCGIRIWQESQGSRRSGFSLMDSIVKTLFD